jgi:integrase
MLPLRHHQKSGQFYFWDPAAKKRRYLGKDCDEARKRYDQLAEEERSKQAAAPAGGITVAGLLLLYYQSREECGTDLRDLAMLKAASRFAVADGRGADPAAGFKAKALQRVREAMIAAHSRRGKSETPKSLSRHYVNKLIRQLQAAWHWCGEQELIPADTAVSVCAVKALRRGRGGRELPRIPAVEPWAVDATLPELAPVVASMVRLQLLAGMRPGELCALRRRDVSLSPRESVSLPETDRTVSAIACGETVVWVAVPDSHKTLWRGKPRAICFGPQSQAILRPFLERGPDEFLFSPARKPGKRFTTQSYGKCVAAAIRRANTGRARSDPPERMIPEWAPNQLRHRAATEVAESFDRATASAVLGNGLAVIDVYVEQELKKAAAAAAKIG